MSFQRRVDFFLEHAGISYRPAKESPFVGSVVGAMQLAAAEERAEANDWFYVWDIDSVTDSSHWDSHNPPHRVWECLLYVPCDQCPENDIPHRRVERCAIKAHLHVGASLHAIDFGACGNPTGEPYARVVEAELASEVRS